MIRFWCACKSIATFFCAFGLVALACQVPAHASPRSTFSYTGTAASYTVPAGVTVLKITATGGGGASGYQAMSGPGADGGAGAVVTSYQRVSPGDVLTVRVGGGGQVFGAGGAATSVTGGSVIIVAGGGGAGGISDVGGSGSAGGTAAGGDGSSSGTSGGDGGNSDGVGTGGSGAGPDSSCGGDAAPAGSGGAGASDGGTASGSSSGGGGGGYAGGAGGASGTAQAGGTSAGFARQSTQAGGGGAGFGGGGGGYFSGGGGYGGGGGSVNCSSQGSGGAGGSFASPSATGYSATTFAPGTNGGDGSSSTAAGDGLVEIEELVYGGSSPAPIVQEFGKPASGACDDAQPEGLDWGGALSGGWGESWSQWMNSGTGGFVCTRRLVYSNAVGHWVVG